MKERHFTTVLLVLLIMAGNGNPREEKGKKIINCTHNHYFLSLALLSNKQQSVDNNKSE